MTHQLTTEARRIGSQHTRTVLSYKSVPTRELELRLIMVGFAKKIVDRYDENNLLFN